MPPEPDNQPAGPPPRRYRFAFVLNTTIGNLTRYFNLRKFAERDPEVDGHWVPVHMVASPRAEAFLRLLPRSVALRLRVAIQVFPTWVRLGRFDAVMLHVFEAEVACAVRSYLFRRPALISSTDEAPAVDRTTYPLYPHQQGKSQRREEFRLKLDRWRATRIDSFVPFTAWGGRILEQGCGVPGERIFPIHVGLDLEQWRPPGAASMREGRPRLLFVGTDFERKGGPLLLSVFERLLRQPGRRCTSCPRTRRCACRCRHSPTGTWDRMIRAWSISMPPVTSSGAADHGRSGALDGPRSHGDAPSNT